MAAKYWIKLYHEILDDFKMHKLPDNLWRRTVELFLLAGDYDRDGELPPVEEIAFRLRMDEKQLKNELSELAKIGIISNGGQTHIVTNFSKRQMASSAADRKRYQRERDKKKPQHTRELVTICDTDKKRIDKSRTDEKEVPCTFCSPSVSREIFTAVTGMIDLPASHRDIGFDAVQAIAATKGTKQEVIDYLQPYYKEWRSRGYSMTNLAWLTDWAVTGEIPPQKKNGDKPKMKMLKGANFDTNPNDFKMVPA